VFVEIFTSIDFIGQGLQYPPTQSTARLTGYDKNLKRFKGTYNKGQSIAVKSKITGNSTQYPIITENYYRLITEKQVGLLLNEHPHVVCSTPETTAILQKLIKNSGFWLQLQKSYRTFSSMGDGVLYLSTNGYGEPTVNSVNPQNWFVVVDSANIDEVLCHVLVHPIYKQDYKSVLPAQRTHLRVLYHYKGYYIERVFKANDTMVLEPCAFDTGSYKIPLKGRRVETGLTDFAVFAFSNNRPIDEVYGLSDYDMICDAVSLYERAFTLIGAIIEQNANPTLAVPKGTGRANSKTGQIEFPGLGSFVEVPPGETIRYVSLDAPINEVMGYIEKLLDEIGVQSELSKSFLCGEYGANSSGEALKVLLKSPLDKISRAIDSIESVIKRLFVQMLMIKGVSVSPADIDIEWQDGIVLDDNSKANAIKTRVESGTLSKKRALMKFDGMSDEQAEAELSIIKNEDKGV
jgi:DNA-binding protein